MKHREIPKEELEVGMKVAIPSRVKTGYSTYFRYSIWRIKTIKALTPKKTKIALESGQEYLATKTLGVWHTGMYEPNKEMELETKLANAYRSANNAVYEMSQKTYSKMSSLKDDDLLSFADFVTRAEELLRGEKKNGQSEGD